MKLYSITDLTHLVQELLHSKNFATIPVSKGMIDVVQTDGSGIVSQRFRILIGNTPAEAL